MMRADPGGFVRVMANILPDKLEVDVKHTIEKIEWSVVAIDHAPHRIGGLVGESGADHSPSAACGLGVAVTWWTWINP
jgi:hypothetical protein